MDYAQLASAGPPTPPTILTPEQILQTTRPSSPAIAQVFDTFMAEYKSDPAGSLAKYNEIMGKSVHNSIKEAARAMLAYDQKTNEAAAQTKALESTSSKTGGGSFANDAEMTSSPEYLQMKQMIELQQQSVADQKVALEQAQSQYEQLRNDYQLRDEELTGYLDGMGASEKAALEKQRSQLLASQKEDLMKRGLTAISALTSALRGVDLMANESLSALESRLREQKLSYKAQFSGETLQAQERGTNFLASAAGTNFAAGEQVAAGMSNLATMLADQRMAGWQNQTELQKTLAQQGSERYAADLGYRSNLYGLAQKETQAIRENSTDLYGVKQNIKLGYAGLENAKTLANIQARAQYMVSDARQTDITRAANYDQGPFSRK